MVKSVKKSQQNSRYPVTALCNYQLQCYVIKLIFLSQAQPEILQPAMYLSDQNAECTTEEELELLELLKKSLVKNYVKYRNAKKQASSQIASSYTMNLLFDNNTRKLGENADRFYYRRYSKILWNTSKYTAIASSSKSLNTNELDNFVRVIRSKDSSTSQNPSYYAKLLDCFCIRRETETGWDRFAIVEKFPAEFLKNIDLEDQYNLLSFDNKIKLGVYWENEYMRGERTVVPLSRIANPVFIIPQYNSRLSKSDRADRFFILDPNVFLEFQVGSKACQLLILDEHKDINKKELEYLQKHLKNKDSVVIKR